MFLYSTVSVLRTLTREPSTETNIKRTGSIEQLVAGRWLAEEPAVAAGSSRPWRTSCWTCWDPSASGRLPGGRRTETWPWRREADCLSSDEIVVEAGETEAQGWVRSA